MGGKMIPTDWIASLPFSERSLFERLVLIVIVVLVVNLVLIAIPGYNSHDELDWLNLIHTNNHGWDFFLGSASESQFFRPLGTILISWALRFHMQPFASHAVLVLFQGANSCLLYLLMLQLYPRRALAAALLFAVMPATSFAAAWIAAEFDVLYVLFGLASMNAAVAFWRGGAWEFAGVSMGAFALALLCKETSLVIPAALLILLYLDRSRAHESPHFF